MSSKTKIVVLKSKELIYTAIFVILGILLVSLLIYMFFPSKDKRKEKNSTDISEIKKSDNEKENTNEIIPQSAPEATVIPPKDEKTDTTTYQSGVYSSVMNVGGQTELQLSVIVDNGNVSHIDITNLNDAVTAMYPLIEPSLDEINAQLETGVSFENLTYSKDNQYTTILIIKAVEDTLTN